MTLDERRFSDPHSFIPERFLPNPEGRGEVLPDSLVFGWGRRVCPGRHLADDTVWLAIARMLACFVILKPVDDKGREYAPEIKFVTAITRRVNTPLSPCVGLVLTKYAAAAIQSPSCVPLGRGRNQRCD